MIESTKEEIDVITECTEGETIFAIFNNHDYHGEFDYINVIKPKIHLINF